MQESTVFWFTTRDDLLEEWGYMPGMWYLVTRSPTFMTAVAVDSHGNPSLDANGDLCQLQHTRVLLAWVSETTCEFLGPIDPTAARRQANAFAGLKRPAAA